MDDLLVILRYLPGCSLTDNLRFLIFYYIQDKCNTVTVTHNFLLVVVDVGALLTCSSQSQHHKELICRYMYAYLPEELTK